MEAVLTLKVCKVNDLCQACVDALEQKVEKGVFPLSPSGSSSVSTSLLQLTCLSLAFQSG